MGQPSRSWWRFARTGWLGTSDKATDRLGRKPSRRELVFERLEGRDLLTVGLAGVQAVDIWQMATDINASTKQGEVLTQTAASFTLTGSSGQAGQSVSVDWGDRSAVYRGTFGSSATASTSHTFSSGTFSVTVTCGTDVTRYRLQSSVIALGHLASAPSQGDMLFIAGNDQINPVVVNTIGRTLHVLVANPFCQRTIASSAVAGIYGSMAGSVDTVTLSATVTQSACFSLGAGNDYFVGGRGADTVLGGAGNDVIFGGQGSNAILGNDGNDWLYAGRSDDVIYGGAGNDYIFAGRGNNMLFGGDGNDAIYGSTGANVLEGDDGNDLLVAGYGPTFLYGGAGNDTLLGSIGNDWLFGGSGNDFISCGGGNDVAVGGAGADQIYGGTGNCILAGGYDFQLHNLNQAGLSPIPSTWVTQRLAPGQLSYDSSVSGSSPNLAIWDDGAVDLLVRSCGRTLLYAGPNDRIVGEIRSGVDLKITTTAATAAAIIDYTSTSGIVNPRGTLGQTTLLLGRFTSDMNVVINQKLQMRKTIDFSDNPGGFLVLNVPDSLYLTSSQFWTDFNQPLLQRSVVRNDVIYGVTTPSSGGGYGNEISFLQTNGYVYDPLTHRFVRT